MKNFIYSYSNRQKGGHTLHTVSLYGIKQNKPFFICTESGYFTGKDQLVMETLIKHKLIPLKYRGNNQFGGTEYNLVSLRDCGFIITHVY